MTLLTPLLQTYSYEMLTLIFYGFINDRENVVFFLNRAFNLHKMAQG